MEKNRRFRSLKDRIMRKKMFARVVKVLIGIILVFPAGSRETTTCFIVRGAADRG